MVRYLTKIVMLATLFWFNAVMADPAVFLNEKGVALSGHDPVAYFTVKSPTFGQDKFTATYQGATYWFSSAENRDAFKAEPAKYAAQYGGYCAYAASLGKKAPGDPMQWTVLNNKLYLNYDERIQKQWSADRAGNIAKADAKWNGIKND